MDFGSMSGKTSMKRKQSNSLLSALSKQTQSRAAIPFNAGTPPPPTATSSIFPSQSTTSSEDHSSVESPYDSGIGVGSGGRSYGHVSGRSVSASTTGSLFTAAGGGSRLSTQHEKGYPDEKKPVKRPDDVLKLVKDRIAAWSFLLQWYEGDIHWFNTVKISRSAIETFVGPSKVDTRARHFFVLGISLAALFDTTSVLEFLQKLLKVLDEWESWSEGSGTKGVKNLFRNQRNGKRPVAAGMSDLPGGVENESSLMIVNLPFQPDFFQVHSSTCNIIRDLYKKILKMVLPAGPAVQTNPGLIHPSTIIHSAELGSFSNPLSPIQQSSSNRDTTPDAEMDALQSYVAGLLPVNRTLVGDGQTLSPLVLDLIQKVDTRLKKHFSTLVREGDALARKVLDDELTSLMASLSSGAAPLRFDYSAALSSAGNGLYGLDTAEIREKGFGTI